jgi:hypothetical protein
MARCPRRPRRPSHHLGAITALVLVVAGVASWGIGAPPPVALADVVHGQGFEATVLGWTSWYGNYGLGDLGWGWCIDHGLLAPDADLAYVPTDVPDASADTRAAVSWAMTQNDAPDPMTSAAVMLVTHDLMGAHYPFGTIDVDRLTPADLGGFGGHEGEIIAAARRIKADASAHAQVRAPFSFTLDAPPTAPGANGQLTATLVDGNGAPVSNVIVAFDATGATLAGTPTRTGEDGRASAAFVAGPGQNQFDAVTTIPDPTLRAFAPTRGVAQRLAQPHKLVARTAAAFTPPPTTSPPTTSPPTTSPPTTSPPTTSPPTSPPTTSPPTTTAPPTSSPPTTSPPTTTAPPTSSPPTSSPPVASAPPAPPTASPPTASPPTTSPPRTATGGSLPVTGTRVQSTALIAIGLVLLGGSLLGVGREPCPTRVSPAHPVRIGCRN